MKNDALNRRIHERLKPYLAAYGLDSNFLRVNGADIHCVRSGQGPLIALVHGFGSFLFTWRQIFRTLTGNYDVFAFDLPGFGLSTMPARFKNGLMHQADFLAAMIKKLKLPPVILVGHSLGGALCMEMCQRHQDMVQAAVLVATAIPGKLSTPASVMNNILLFKYFNKALITKDVLDVIDLVNKREQPKNLTHLLLSTSFDECNVLKCPALIIWGESDRVINQETSREIEHYFKNSQRKIIKNCGHAPHEERPDEFTDLILPFLMEQ